MNHPDNYELREKVAAIVQPGKYEYMMKACALAVSGDLTFTGVIELKRLMVVLKFINSELTADEIWYLAKESG